MKATVAPCLWLRTMSRLVSSIHSLSSGLLLLPLRPSVSDSSRLKAACSAINHRLFSDLADINDNQFQIMSPKDLSHRLQQLYSYAFALAPHLDVRILLLRMELQRMGKEAVKVVVVEAAALLQAGWDDECDEVWVHVCCCFFVLFCFSMRGACG